MHAALRILCAATARHRLRPAFAEAARVAGLALISSLLATAAAAHGAHLDPAAAAQGSGVQGAVAQGSGGQGSGGQRAEVSVPPVDVGVAMMPIREFAQRQTLDQFRVFKDFRFQDRRVASGIRFRHEIVEDAGKEYKAVHYDHGNGLAVADVDGDGFQDLYFISQLGGNELWRGVGGGRFEEITEQAGVALEGRIGVTAAFADVDNDGDPDLFVTTVRTGNVLLRNEGGGRFTDVTAASGLAYEGHSSGAVFFDYDRDGWLDLFVTNVGQYTTEAKGPGGYFVGFRNAFSGHLFPARTEASLLYRNLGDGRFEEVSEQVGLVDVGWAGDASFTDLNGDGYPDLYVLNMQGDDHYWENQGGARFVEKTQAHFSKTPWGTMGIKFFDYDNDGLMDLMLTDMHSDMSREVTPGYEKLKSVVTWSDEDYLQGGGNNVFGNAFFHNRGGGAFDEVSDRIGAENYWPWGLSVGDLNADGFQDVFITASMNFPWRYGVNTVLLNNQGETFLDSEFILGVEPRVGGEKRPWFTNDCSGVDRDRPLCRGRSGPLQVLGNAGSRASVILDVDQDGDLDIVTSEFNDYPQVLISDLSAQRQTRWVEVALRGTKSNRDGLGAWVRVRAGGKTYTQYHDGKSGYLTQSSMPLYFGLGDAESIEEIEVVWPSGDRQVKSDGLEMGSRIEIREE